MSSSTTERSRGRPRSAATDRAILEATRTLLRSRGYSGVSIEGIAREAGVAKTTIYRRWENKSFLVFDAVFGNPEESIAEENSGGEVSLRSVVRAVCKQFSTPEARIALPGILSELVASEQLRDKVENQVLGPERDSVRRMLRQAQKEGQIREDVDLDAALDCIIGPAFYRMFDGGEFNDEFEQGILDALLRGIGPAR